MIKKPKNKGILPPYEAEMGGTLRFTGLTEKKRYFDLQKLSIVQCKFLHDSMMCDLDVYDEVYRMISNISWNSYFYVHFPVLLELCREFYATYAFEIVFRF